MIYHCALSDSTHAAIDADSAADAIQSALDQHRGLTVTKCWRGNGVAGINYEVPSHKALPLTVRPAKPHTARESQLF